MIRLSLFAGLLFYPSLYRYITLNDANDKSIDVNQNCPACYKRRQISKGDKNHCQLSPLEMS